MWHQISDGQNVSFLALVFLESVFQGKQNAPSLSDTFFWPLVHVLGLTENGEEGDIMFYAYEVLAIRSRRTYRCGITTQPASAGVLTARSRF